MRATDRDEGLVRPVAKDPAIVGPYSDWIEDEAERERIDRRPLPTVAHEDTWVMLRLKEIAEKHHVPIQALVEAFYVGRFSAQGGGDA